MAASGALSRLFARVRTVRNLVVAVAVVLAMPTGLYIGSVTGESGVGFLLLMVVGVAVPSAYDRRWHERFPDPVEAVAWTVAACAVSTTVYVGFYLLGRTAVGDLLAATVAFVCAWGFVLLVEQVVEQR